MERGRLPLWRALTHLPDCGTALGSNCHRAWQNCRHLENRGARTKADDLGAMLLFDAHLDLAMNALEWNRDLTQSIDAIRSRERGATDKPDRGAGTVCFSEMRRGAVGLCVATQIARFVKPG